jgi:1,4-dihydroxy-2-naphthoate octaprenyltransferase
MSNDTTSMRMRLPHIPGTPGIRFTAVRAYSFTASILPAVIAAAYGAAQGYALSWLRLVLVGIGVVSIHAASNIVNDIEDFRHGIDSATHPGTHGILARGLLSARQLWVQAYVLFALGALAGGLIAVQVGWGMVAAGLMGMAGGYGYTAPPLYFKYRGWGEVVVFVLYGPLLMSAAFAAVYGRWAWMPVLLSLPVALTVVAILHGNNCRDYAHDKAHGITTMAIRLGFGRSRYTLGVLLVAPYMLTALLVVAGVLSVWSLLVVVTLVPAVRVLRDVCASTPLHVSRIADIDKRLAGVQGAFAVLFLAGIIW